MASSVFKQASRVAVYLHCARLREVDTSAIVQETLSSGDIFAVGCLG